MRDDRPAEREPDPSRHLWQSTGGTVSTLSGRMAQAIRQPCLRLPGHLHWKPVGDAPGKESGKAQPAAARAGPRHPPPTPTRTPDPEVLATPTPKPDPPGTEMACRSEEGSKSSGLPKGKALKLAGYLATAHRWGESGSKASHCPGKPPRRPSRHPWIPHPGSERREHTGPTHPPTHPPEAEGNGGQQTWRGHGREGRGGRDVGVGCGKGWQVLAVGPCSGAGQRAEDGLGDRRAGWRARCRVWVRLEPGSGSQGGGLGSAGLGGRRASAAAGSWGGAATASLVYGHTTLNAPDLV